MQIVNTYIHWLKIVIEAIVVLSQKSFMEKKAVHHHASLVHLSTFYTYLFIVCIHNL